MTHEGATQGHFTGLPNAISHVIEAPVPTTIVVTQPTADIPISGIPPEMTADLAIDLENNTTNWPKDPHHPHTLHHGGLKTENIKQVTIDDLLSDYYNSDDNDSNSDDDLN